MPLGGCTRPFQSRNDAIRCNIGTIDLVEEQPVAENAGDRGERGGGCAGVFESGEVAVDDEIALVRPVVVADGRGGAYVMRVLTDMGAAPIIRDNYRTDQGNLVIDCHFASLEDPRAAAATLSAIPGILGHGLFLDEVSAAYIATNGVVTRLERTGASD